MFINFDPPILMNMFHIQSSESLRNLSPELFGEIQDLSEKSLAIMTNLFRIGVDAGVFAHQSPEMLAGIAWSLFSGIILMEESRIVVSHDHHQTKETREAAFDIFLNGIRK
jgi:hypothetical protein